MPQAQSYRTKRRSQFFPSHICLRAILSFILTCPVTAPVFAATSTDERDRLCERALLGTKMLIESIATMECHYKLTRKERNVTTVLMLTYTRIGAEERLVYVTPGTPSSTIATDGTTIKYTTNVKLGGKTKLEGGITGNKHIMSTKDSYWDLLEFSRQHAAILKLEGRNKGRLPSKLFPSVTIPNASGLHHKGIEVTDEFMTLDKVHAKGYEKRQYDETYNYLCTSFERHLPTTKGSLVTTTTLSNVKETAPGVYLPYRIQVVYRDESGSTPSSTLTAEIDTLTINNALNQDAVRIMFPRGMTVRDYVRQVIYESDGAGGSASPVKPLPKPVKP